MVAAQGVVALSSPFSNERVANRHQLFNNLAFTHRPVVNARLPIQSERGAAKRTALAWFKEMSPQSFNPSSPLPLRKDQSESGLAALPKITVERRLDRRLRNPELRARIVLPASRL